jgi:tetratricopeptide (TPR) repeat protein
MNRLLSIRWSGGFVSTQLGIEPGARASPPSLRRRDGNPKCFGALGHGTSAEKTKLDQFGALGVEYFQLCERLVEPFEVDVLALSGLGFVFERELDDAAATLRGAPRSGMVDEDASHRFSCKTEVFRLRGCFLKGFESTSKVKLMHEHGWGPRMTGGLASHLRQCDSFELRVNGLERRGVARGRREFDTRMADRLMQKKFEEEFRRRPKAHTEIALTVADAYHSVGAYDRAIQLLRKIVELRESLPTPDDDILIECKCRLAAAHFRAQQARAVAVEVASMMALIERTLISSRHDQADGSSAGLRQLDRFLKTLEIQITDQPPATTFEPDASEYAAAALALIGATTSIERVAKLAASRVGENDRRVLALRAFHGFIYEGLGQKQLALQSFAASLQAMEAIDDSKGVWPLLPRMNLARIHHDLGNYQDALPHFQQLLKQVQDRLGIDHPHAANVQRSLGICFGDLGRFDEAIKLLEDSLQRQQLQLGKDHPDAVLTLGELAKYFRKAKRYPQAIKCYERLRQIQSEWLKADHPDALSTLMALADANQSAGDAAKAVTIYEEVRNLQAKSLAPDHPDFLHTLHELANSLTAADRHAEAAKLGELVVRDRTKILGPNHEDTTTSVYNLAFAYREMNDVKRSLPLFERAASNIENGGFKHPLTRQILPTMIMALENSDKFEVTNRLRRNWLGTLKRRGDGESQLYSWQLESLGESLLKQRRWAEAEVSLRECRAIREKTHPNSPLCSRTQSLLGAALTAQRKFSEAETALLQGFEGLSRAAAKEPRPPQRAALEKYAMQAVDRVIEFYQTIKNQEAIKKWQAVRSKFSDAPIQRSSLPNNGK